MPDGSVPSSLMVLPHGKDIRGRDGRLFRCSNRQKVIEAFNRRGMDMPIDLEHATEVRAPFGEPAPAVGWAVNLEEQEGGVHAAVEWTLDGKQLVQNRSYRYYSPVFLIDTNTREIMEIMSVGLTNRPNLHVPALNAQQGEEDTVNKELLAALGLPEGASDAEATAKAVEMNKSFCALQTQGSSPGKDREWVPIADYRLALNRAEEAEQKLKAKEDKDIQAEINAAIEEGLRAGKVAPASRESWLKRVRNREDLAWFKDHMKTAPVVASGNSESPQGQPPGGNTAVNSEEMQVARAMGYTDAEYQRVKNGAAGAPAKKED